MLNFLMPSGEEVAVVFGFMPLRFATVVTESTTPRCREYGSVFTATTGASDVLAGTQKVAKKWPSMLFKEKPNNA